MQLLMCQWMLKWLTMHMRAEKCQPKELLCVYLSMCVYVSVRMSGIAPEVAECNLQHGTRLAYSLASQGVCSLASALRGALTD